MFTFQMTNPNVTKRLSDLLSSSLLGPDHRVTNCPGKRTYKGWLPLHLEVTKVRHSPSYVLCYQVDAYTECSKDKLSKCYILSCSKWRILYILFKVQFDSATLIIVVWTSVGKLKKQTTNFVNSELQQVSEKEISKCYIYPWTKCNIAQRDAFCTYFWGYNLNATLIIVVWTYVG